MESSEANKLHRFVLRETFGYLPQLLKRRNQLLEKVSMDALLEKLISFLVSQLLERPDTKFKSRRQGTYACSSRQQKLSR